MNLADQKRFIRLALKHGARIENGRKHVKVYASDGRYLVSLKHGTTGYTGRGDEAMKIARREGWL